MCDISAAAPSIGPVPEDARLEIYEEEERRLKLLLVMWVAKAMKRQWKAERSSQISETSY